MIQLGQNIVFWPQNEDPGLCWVGGWVGLSRKENGPNELNDSKKTKTNIDEKICSSVNLEREIYAIVTLGKLP